jgi:undecaprenyl-diphosphatase
MSVFHAVVLALVQGLTEFLPVSSSGHLALAELVLDRPALPGDVGIFYEVLLHVATLLAVVIWFRREIWELRAAFGRSREAREARRVIALIAVASVPTAAIGLAIKDAAERAFTNPLLVGVGLLVTSALLASTARLLGRRANGAAPPPAGTPGSGERWITDLARLRFRDALVVGTVQGGAVWPGVSRSGSTIVAALWMGVPPVTAARFSLLVSLPAIAGAFCLKLRDLEGVPPAWAAWVVGFVVTAIVGYLSIGWLLAIVRSSRLKWFAAYTGTLGAVAVILARA